MVSFEKLYETFKSYKKHNSNGKCYKIKSEVSPIKGMGVEGLSFFVVVFTYRKNIFKISVSSGKDESSNEELLKIDCSLDRTSSDYINALDLHNPFALCYDITAQLYDDPFWNSLEECNGEQELVESVYNYLIEFEKNKLRPEIKAMLRFAKACSKFKENALNKFKNDIEKQGLNSGYGNIIMRNRLF